MTYSILLALYGAGYWFLGPDLGIGLDLFGVSIALWIISEILHRWWSPRPPGRVRSCGVCRCGRVWPEPRRNVGRTGRQLVGGSLSGCRVCLPSSPRSGRRTYTPWYWVGVASFLAAYSIWLTGTATSPSCRPDSLLQAHADSWHLMTAVATYCFFRFLRTERAVGSGRANSSIWQTLKAFQYPYLRRS